MQRTFLVLAFASAVALSLGCEDPAPKKGGKPAAKDGAKKEPKNPNPNKVPSRDEAKSRLMGKSKAEVLKLIGKPKRTSPGGHEVWYYDTGISYDPIAQRVDDWVAVYFDQGGNVDAIGF